MNGFSGHYTATRADISASMQAAEASVALLQRFTAYPDTNAHYTYRGAILHGRKAVFAMAREAMQRDPAVAGKLAKYPLNSPEWIATAQRLFETMPVVVKFMVGPDVIDVMMGKGDAMLTVLTVG